MLTQSAAQILQNTSNKDTIKGKTNIKMKYNKDSHKIYQI